MPRWALSDCVTSTLRVGILITMDLRRKEFKLMTNYILYAYMYQVKSTIKSLKSLFFMRLMAGRRLAFRTNSALFKDTWVRS